MMKDRYCGNKAPEVHLYPPSVAGFLASKSPELCFITHVIDWFKGVN